METSFDSRSACEQHLADVLDLSPSKERNRQLLRAFSDASEIRTPSRIRAARVGRWVIRDSDLRLFQTLRDALLACASSHYVFADLSASAFTGLAAALVGLIRNAYRSGGHLTSTQLQVLAILQSRREPIAFRHLLRLLSKHETHQWTERKLREHLSALEAFPTSRGFVRLVESANDKWTTSDV